MDRVTAKSADRGKRRAFVPVVVCLLVATPSLASAHTILEPEVVRGVLLDIARSRQESRGGADEAARLEALYQLGQKVQDLVELMNQDVGAHGAGDFFARLIVRRLQEYGIQVQFVEHANRYAYDFAPYREYLERAPRGKRAADVRYRLIAEAFYRTLRMDTPGMLDGDAQQLAAAIAEEEQFLKDFPDDRRAKEVRLIRATDYYRLFKNAPDPVQAKHYETLAREALGEVVARERGSPEARAAEGLLERLRGGRDRLHRAQ